MFRVFCLVIGVAVEIVSQEAYCLHVCEPFGGIGEEFGLKWGEETSCAFNVSFGKLSENLHVESYIAGIGVVLSSGIGRAAQEVTEIREYERRHHCVKIDDTYHVALRIKEYIVNLGVAVAYAFR